MADRPQIGVATIRTRGFSVESRARATEGRARNVAARRASTLRRDFQDKLHWAKLASARSLILPPWGTPPTPGLMERWLRKLSVSVAAYLDWTGEKSLRDFAVNNSLWPMRAWVGLLLEWQSEDG